MLTILKNSVIIITLLYSSQMLAEKNNHKFLILDKPATNKELAPITYKQMLAAIRSNNIKDVKKFIITGADVNLKSDRGESYLHQCKNVKIMQLLISVGADVNAADRYGNSPLHNAVAENNLQNVQLLLRSNANINQKNNSGKVPLHYIGLAGKYTSNKRSYDRQLNILKSLLNRGANVNVTSNNGWTVLHMLTIDNKIYINYDDLMQRIEMAKLILTYGADIKAKDNRNSSILFRTAYDYKNKDKIDEKGYVAWIEFLIDNGIEVDVQNGKGQTPIEIMRDAKGETPSVKFLMLHSSHYKTRSFLNESETYQSHPSDNITNKEATQKLKEERATQVAKEFAGVLGKISRKTDKQSSMDYIHDHCQKWINGFKEKDPRIHTIVLETCTQKAFEICCSDME